MKRTTTKRRNIRSSNILSKIELAAMVEEATLDAYGDSEQTVGWFTKLEEHLELPFATSVLGTTVTVTRIDLRDTSQIVAICKRGRDRQAIALVDLPLPSPRPAGSEWIEAYRYWLTGR